MEQRFEYKFVRLKVGFLGNQAELRYQETVHQHAREGWRLVQVFAPGISSIGTATYYELIFERPVG